MLPDPAHVRKGVVQLRSRATVVTGLLAAGTIAAVTVFALVGSTGMADPEVVAARPAAARTSFPGLKAAVGEPDLASIRAARPRSGQVLQAKGPFDDRFVLEGATFDGSAVAGAVRITSDVSDVLELQVLAGFYDVQGNLLGTNRFVHHLGSDGHAHTGPPDVREEFTIPVPAALANQAVSVAIGVPVLVNE
jgi:hypothetical protein